jgi:hypothetical protein
MRMLISLFFMPHTASLTHIVVNESIVLTEHRQIRNPGVARRVPTSGDRPHLSLR